METIDALLGLLEEYEYRYDRGILELKLYADGSGKIENEEEYTLFEFESINELKTKLDTEIKKLT